MSEANGNQAPRHSAWHRLNAICLFAVYRFPAPRQKFPVRVKRIPCSDLQRIGVQLSWAKKLMQTKPFKLVAVALANKMARIAFAIMRGKTSYSVDPA